ncbi:hypothetical protein N9Z18_02575 [Verrucomicrobiales bacterium]|jgi:hypothetical protein|nr:hypothetical protein [Verrucomicrobiales bacterium]
MKYLPVFSALAFLSIAIPTVASAGGTGFFQRHSGKVADSKFQTPRYNQILPYRHYEDHRRYNAAACCNEVVPATPYVIKTVVVSKRRVPHYYTDSRGQTRSRKVLTVVYKDIYSNGRCRVWSEAL